MHAKEAWNRIFEQRKMLRDICQTILFFKEIPHNISLYEIIFIFLEIFLENFWKFFENFRIFFWKFWIFLKMFEIFLKIFGFFLKIFEIFLKVFWIFFSKFFNFFSKFFNFFKYAAYVQYFVLYENIFVGIFTGCYMIFVDVPWKKEKKVILPMQRLPYETTFVRPRQNEKIQKLLSLRRLSSRFIMRVYAYFFKNQSITKKISSEVEKQNICNIKQTQ